MPEWLKNLARRVAPALYPKLRTVYWRLIGEFRVLRQVGIGVFLPRAERQVRWEEELPVQAIRTVELGGASSSSAEFSEILEGMGIPHSRGTYAVYLPPDVVAASPFAALVAGMPTDSGLKVMRQAGPPASTPYADGAEHSRLHLALIYGHRHLSLVANRLAEAGVGPKLHDLLEFGYAGQRWTAYVVEHLPLEATGDAGAGCIAALEALCASDELALVTPQGFDHVDFQPPHYQNNVRARQGSPTHGLYVDFQNIRFPDYGRYLERVARAAAEASHFGDASLLRGGRYLYQRVPGVALPAKRDFVERMRTIDALLAEGGVSLRDRVVLDVGCNIGMAIAEYLRRGAVWCHGWDRSRVVPETEKVLRAIGCTRFSLAGRDLDPDAQLEDDLPPAVVARLDGCVLSYLAVRGHIGWLDAVVRMPWRHMIYEGHEGEDLTVFEAHVAELADRTPVVVRARAMYRDGDSRPRPVALIERAAPR